MLHEGNVWAMGMQHKSQPSQIDKCSPAASNFIRQNVGLQESNIS